MKKSIFKYTKVLFGIVLLTAWLLWSHIWIQRFSSPILLQLEQGLQYPSPEQYNFVFMLGVFLTAIISTALIVFLYYHCGHLLNIKNKILKSLVLALILLEVKQDLIRRPVIDWLMHQQIGSDHALKITFFRSLDVWLPNLIFAFLLVYFCKTRESMQKTLYLTSIPGLVEDVKAGRKTPKNKLSKRDELPWSKK